LRIFPYYRRATAPSSRIIILGFPPRPLRFYALPLFFHETFDSTLQIFDLIIASKFSDFVRRISSVLIGLFMVYFHAGRFDGGKSHLCLIFM
jgi:hypothetical protein